MLNARQETVVVVADSTLASLRFLTGGHISLEQYLDKTYPKSVAPAGATARELRLLDYLGSGTGTTYADAANVKVLTSLAGGLASKLVLRHARDLRSRDLQHGNSILMGSPIVDPWVSLFQPYLNFQEDDELVSRGEKYFLNRSPRPGERERYRWSYNTGISYGTIALVPNEQHNGNVLILQGLDHCGTEALGVFLFEAESRAKLREALLKLTPRPEEAWFEALIQAESIGGAPGRAEVVAARLIK